MGDAYDDLEAAQCRDCMKLREQVETLTKNAMNRPKDCPSCNTWADNVALRAWVGRLTTEQDEDALLQPRITMSNLEMASALTAAQAREAKLRWYLENYRGQVNQYGQETASTALALLTDDSALMERLKEEYKRGYKAGITTGSMT